MNISRIVNISLRSALATNVRRNGLKSSCNLKLLSFAQNWNVNSNQISFVSTYEVKNVQKEESVVKKILKKIPFLNVDQMKIKARGYMLYEEIADKIDYFEFFNEFNLPDTFFSWFTVTELHIWMLSLRAVAEGDDGRILRNAIIEALWTDVAQRIKKLGAGSPSRLREHVVELSEQMQAAFIAYDEGIQSDDIVLAGAIWRRFYKMEHVDPHNLDKLVKYIRKQVTILDTLPTNDLFTESPIKWESFKSS